jgi:hypothetical protein
MQKLLNLPKSYQARDVGLHARKQLLSLHQNVHHGMISIRNENGSHNPDEAMDIDDFMLGVQVLADAIQNI